MESENKKTAELLSDDVSVKDSLSLSVHKQRQKKLEKAERKSKKLGFLPSVRLWFRNRITKKSNQAETNKSADYYLTLKSDIARIKKALNNNSSEQSKKLFSEIVDKYNLKDKKHEGFFTKYRTDLTDGDNQDLSIVLIALKNIADENSIYAEPVFNKSFSVSLKEDLLLFKRSVFQIKWFLLRFALLVLTAVFVTLSEIVHRNGTNERLAAIFMDFGIGFVTAWIILMADNIFKQMTKKRNAVKSDFYEYNKAECVYFKDIIRSFEQKLASSLHYEAACDYIDFIHALQSYLRSNERYCSTLAYRNINFLTGLSALKIYETKTARENHVAIENAITSLPISSRESFTLTSQQEKMCIKDMYMISNVIDELSETIEDVQKSYI